MDFMNRFIKREIVLVDGESKARGEIQRLLMATNRNYTIHAAGAGQEGLELYGRRTPDCLLIDLDLPDIEWTAFLDALRPEPGGALTLPVVVMTAEQDDERGTEALRRGAEDYLVKAGLTGPTLVRAIENAIEKFEIHRELLQSRVTIELRNQKLALLRDELQEKVTALAEATRAKDQFMAVMSHEMRTPLNAIIGYADLLEMELDGGLTPAQREKIQRIQVGGRHLLSLINDVLDLARSDANKLEIDLRPVDLGAILDEVSALLERQANEKGVSLIVEPVDRALPLVQADVNRLRQILTNLVGNAIKFTEDGEVRVRCEAADEKRVLVRVIDTGIGIEPQVLPLIFSEFYQAHGELTREKGGSGLGLAIAQRLANLMGGEIQAESQPGEGSTFTLSLRAAASGSERREEDVRRHAARMELQSVTSTDGTRRAPAVSVVAFGHDDATLAELERQVHPGVRLHWTSDPDEVPRLAIRERASLIVLDVSCANGDAWRVAHNVQEDPTLSQAAILLLPSIPPVSKDEDGVGLDLGWLSLVPKPFTAAQLTYAVSTAAQRRRVDEASRARAGAFDVLVVDDDPDSRQVASKFLEAASLNVREAPDGESALAEMHRLAPDVVVLDLMMPVLDGFGVLATMRADPDLQGIPVVVLTAKTLTEAERQFLSRTAVRVLQKGEHRLADVAALVLRAAARSYVPDSAATPA